MPAKSNVNIYERFSFGLLRAGVKPLRSGFYLPYLSVDNQCNSFQHFVGEQIYDLPYLGIMLNLMLLF